VEENLIVNCCQACANDLGLPHLPPSLHDDPHVHHNFFDLVDDLVHFEEDWALDQTGFALHLTCGPSHYSVDHWCCLHKDDGHQPSDLPMTQIAKNQNHLLGQPEQSNHKHKRHTLQTQSCCSQTGWKRIQDSFKQGLTCRPLIGGSRSPVYRLSTYTSLMKLRNLPGSLDNKWTVQSQKPNVWDHWYCSKISSVSEIPTAISKVYII
jgi:hypothetical protein